MTDVPSHTWALATVLKRSGVDFMQIGCNDGSGSPELPLLFWWEGPDGSRLLTMHTRSYGTGLHPPAGWPCKTWLALMVTGDNCGPPTPEEVKRLLEQAGRELPGVKIRMGRMSDFADAIFREKPSLPVVRADPSDTWISGIMSMPIETRLARNLRPAIAAYESLNTLLGAWGVQSPPCRQAVAAAYEGTLMFGEHTWGYDAKQFPRLYGKAWQEAEAAGRCAAGGIVGRKGGLCDQTGREDPPRGGPRHGEVGQGGQSQRTADRGLQSAALASRWGGHGGNGRQAAAVADGRGSVSGPTIPHRLQVDRECRCDLARLTCLPWATAPSFP